MASDLLTMMARIASEMARPDFGFGGIRNPNCRDAINTAISEYQKQRFRFSDINPAIPTTFSTAPMQSVYQIADNPNIGTMLHIDYLNIQMGNTLQQLYRTTPERQHLNIQLFTQIGFPSSFAYEGNSIILYPVPDTAYTMYLGAHLLVPGPANDTDTTSPWMDDGELLIRCRAKYELYTHMLRNAAMSAQFSPDPGGNNGKDGETFRAWKSLKGVGNKITGTGRIRPMSF